jgi:hypothetical protein
MIARLGYSQPASAIGKQQRGQQALRSNSNSGSGARAAVRATHHRNAAAARLTVARGAARDPSDSTSTSSSTSSSASGIAALVGTPVFTALQLGELLVILGLIDAGYSGDWSRIGAISKETELVLQKLSLIVIVGHLGTAAWTGVLAARKGKSPVLPAVKGFLFGALGVYEEQHST